MLEENVSGFIISISAGSDCVVVFIPELLWTSQDLVLLL